MKILLMNGHGYNYNVKPSKYDCGATGNGYKEADLTRELADLVEKKLKKHVTVVRYPKERNAYEDVQAGTFTSNISGGISSIDYAYEIHFNAYKKDETKDGVMKGTECYVTSLEEGITVEQKIMKNLSKFFPLRDNDNIFDGVKRTNFSVIMTCKNYGVSGSLLETCFIDDADDIAKYQANKDAIAEAIASGILEGFGITESNDTADDEKPASSVSMIASGSSGSTTTPGSTTSSKTKKVLYLPASATSWRVYPTDKAPVVGNECGYLNPSLFGGLEYDVLATPQTDVVTIETRDFGKVNIYVAASTGAVIKNVSTTSSGTSSSASSGSGGTSAKKKLYLPASATSWRVYPTDKAPVVGNECGFLYPNKFGGLTYEILATPQTDVVTIQTRDYGKVNIYVAASTGAVIK